MRPTHCMDAGGRARQDAKVEGWGEGKAWAGVIPEEDSCSYEKPCRAALSRALFFDVFQRNIRARRVPLSGGRRTEGTFREAKSRMAGASFLVTFWGRPSVVWKGNSPEGAKHGVHAQAAAAQKHRIRSRRPVTPKPKQVPALPADRGHGPGAPALPTVCYSPTGNIFLRQNEAPGNNLHSFGASFLSARSGSISRTPQGVWGSVFVAQLLQVNWVLLSAFGSRKLRDVKLPGSSLRRFYNYLSH